MNFRGSLRDSMNGFTLVELLVAVIVFAILAAIAAPSINQSLANRRMKNAASELQSSILQARAMAATLGRPVELWPAYTTSTTLGSYWNVPSASRTGTPNLPAAEANSATIAALTAAKLSWYGVTPCVASTSASCPTVSGGAAATIANSTANSYPIQVALPNQTLITVGTTPTPATGPTAANGIRFLANGTIGNITTTSTVLTQVSFRICDSAVTGESGYTVLVSQYGTVRVIYGPTTAATDPNDTVGNLACT